jgi:hypothetical protein
MIYTRAQIRTQARVAADQDGTTSFPTDAAYNDIINLAADFVWRRMVNSGWKPTKATTTITATGVAVALPGPVATIDTVYPVASLSSTVPIGPALKRVKPESLVTLLTAPTGSTLATAYDLFNGSTSVGASTSPSIQLFPPVTSGFYVINYTPQFSGFTNDADTWSGPEGSAELIILQSAIDGANKENDPGGVVPSLQSKLEKRTQEIIDFSNFLFERPQTVRDVHHVNQIKNFGFNAHEGWDEW